MMNEQQVFQGLQQAQGFAPQQQPNQAQGFAPQQPAQPPQDSGFVLRVPLMFNHASKGRVRCFIESAMSTGTVQEAQQIVLGLEAQGYPVEWWGGEQQQDNGFNGGQQGQGYQQQRQGYGNRSYGRRNYGGRY